MSQQELPSHEPQQGFGEEHDRLESLTDLVDQIQREFFLRSLAHRDAPEADNF